MNGEVCGEAAEEGAQGRFWRARPPHVGGGRMVRIAWCAVRNCNWMYITRQDRTDEANLGPGLLELGKATGDGTYLSTVARGTCRILWATPAARSWRAPGRESAWEFEPARTRHRSGSPRRTNDPTHEYGIRQPVKRMRDWFFSWKRLLSIWSIILALAFQ